MGSLFNTNVILDEVAFETAAKDFIILSGKMESLQKDITELLGALEKGFNTPAGRKFMRSCQKNLLDQLRDQADVIKHVSDNLTAARTAYESVFNEYRTLNSSIKNV